MHDMCGTGVELSVLVFISIASYTISCLMLIAHLHLIFQCNDHSNGIPGINIRYTQVFHLYKIILKH